jgi:hypothetical protein
MRRPTGRLIVFICAAALLIAQNPNIIVDTAMTAKIRDEAMSAASQVALVFDTLTIDIGPRLTNSPAYYRAVDFVAGERMLLHAATTAVALLWAAKSSGEPAKSAIMPRVF